MNIYSTIKLMSLTRHFLREIYRTTSDYLQRASWRKDKWNPWVALFWASGAASNEQPMSRGTTISTAFGRASKKHGGATVFDSFLQRTAFRKEHLKVLCVVFYSRQLWRTGFSWAPIKSLLLLRELIHEFLFLYCIFLFGYAISYLLMQWMR